MSCAGLTPRILLFLALAVPLAAATPGIFEGMVYETNEPRVPRGWILVQGKNGMLRKVEISRARVAYAQSVPGADRVQEPSLALVHGTEVRVTAEQDSTGEWRASEIEILRLAKPKSRATAECGSTASALFGNSPPKLLTSALWSSKLQVAG